MATLDEKKCSGHDDLERVNRPSTSPRLGQSLV